MMPTANTLPSGLPEPVVQLTTHNPEGQAEIHSSRPNNWTWFRHDTVGFNVIYTNTFPANLNDNADITAHEARMQRGALGLVHPGGTVCRIVDFGPGHVPLMHRTQSLDYGVVLEGEVEMELDGGSVRILKRGDVAVQRGTRHAWRNTSSTNWARMLFVLQDCQPVAVGETELKEDLGHGTSEIPQSGNNRSTLG